MLAELVNAKGSDGWSQAPSYEMWSVRLYLTYPQATTRLPSWLNVDFWKAIQWRNN